MSTIKKCLIAIGGGAGNFVNAMDLSEYKIVVINQDTEALKYVKNNYCFSREEQVKTMLVVLIKKFTDINVVISLGGSSNKELIVKTIKILSEYNKKIHVVATLPFSFEGDKRKKIAAEVSHEISSYISDIHFIENDKYLDLNEKSMNKMFKKIDYAILDSIKY